MSLQLQCSGAVPPWQTDAEVDVGTIFMFETATIPATGSLFFLQLKFSSKSSSLPSKTTQFPIYSFQLSL